MVSINYTVPAKASIELWDGGVPVKLEPGQTVESLATQYSVPAWAIKQASGIAETGASSLEVGQRLVIPLHLNALAPTAGVEPARGPTPPSISEPEQAPVGSTPRTNTVRPGAIGTWR
jgi:LysM repeat protein